MAQEAYYPSVSIDIAKIMIRFAVERGIDEAKLWRNSGLDKILPRRDDARLTASHFHSLWQAIEQETGDVLFGLRLGSALKMYAGGHLGICGSNEQPDCRSGDSQVLPISLHSVQCAPASSD